MVSLSTYPSPAFSSFICILEFFFNLINGKLYDICDILDIKLYILIIQN